MTATAPRPAGTDPIDRIQWLDSDRLEPNPWNPNRVHKAELKLLERSLLLTGWIQPILANPDGLIIDGFHRWRLSQDSKAVRRRDGGRVPVAVLEVSRAEAMLMTVRINRAKGIHVALEMHKLVWDLIENHGYTVDELMVELGGTRDEVEALSQKGLFAARGTAQHAYSQAWYPIEDGRTIAQSRADLKAKR